MLMLLWTKPCFHDFLNIVHMFLIFKPFCGHSVVCQPLWSQLEHFFDTSQTTLALIYHLCVSLFDCTGVNTWNTKVFWCFFLSTIQKVCLTKYHLHHSVLSRKHQFHLAALTLKKHCQLKHKTLFLCLSFICCLLNKSHRGVFYVPKEKIPQIRACSLLDLWGKMLTEIHVCIHEWKT